MTDEEASKIRYALIQYFGFGDAESTIYARMIAAGDIDEAFAKMREKIDNTQTAKIMAIAEGFKAEQVKLNVRIDKLTEIVSKLPDK